MQNDNPPHRGLKSGWLARCKLGVGDDFMHVVLRDRPDMWIVHDWNAIQGGYGGGDYFPKDEVGRAWPEAWKRFFERCARYPTNDIEVHDFGSNPNYTWSGEPPGWAPAGRRRLFHEQSPRLDVTSEGE